MINRIIGSWGVERQGQVGASTVILKEENIAFKQAMEEATAQGKGGRSSPIKIDGREYIVEDDGASRSVKPI